MIKIKEGKINCPLAHPASMLLVLGVTILRLAVVNLFFSPSTRVVV